MFPEACVSGEDYYPYSSDLEKLIEYGSTIKLHPIYVIGLSREQLHSLRNAYSNPNSKIRVGIYGIYDTSVLLQRIGLEPTVIVLSEDIRITGDIAEFIKKFRTPVLRLQKFPVHLHQLPHEDYYGGVYETMDSGLITDSEEITWMLNLGILIWLRNHGETKRLKSAFDVYEVQEDARASGSVRKSQLPEPEPSWDAFVTKQMHGYVPDAKYNDSVKNLDTAQFGNTDSSFVLNLDT